MFNRIRISLTLWYVVVLLAIVGVIAIVTYTVLYRSLTSEVDNSLESSARQIAAQVSEQSLSSIPDTSGSGDSGQGEEGDEEHEENETETEEEEEHGVRFFGATSGDTFYLVLDPGGSPILDPLNVNVVGVPDSASAAKAARDGSDWETLSSEGSDYRLYSQAVTDEGRTIAVVQVGRSLDEHQEQLQMLAIVLAATAFGGLGLAAAGGLFVAGRALRPVREAFQRQRAFVADASHELRTPLTLLRGNAELLQMTAAAHLSGEDVQSVREIVRQTEQIERLISDMSTLARMDEGQLLLQPAPVDIGELLRSAAADARLLAAGKDMAVYLETDGDLRIAADETRIRELLLALVDNAVRYTPPGGTITLRATAADSHVEVSASDTGPGIPAEHIERVFERFYRVDPSRSREQGGSGLGLSIARAIAEAHGGSLTVSSKEGTGATFTLQLPRGGPPAAGG
jgi:signal transduction histidine kinase